MIGVKHPLLSSKYITDLKRQLTSIPMKNIMVLFMSFASGTQQQLVIYIPTNQWTIYAIVLPLPISRLSTHV